MNSILLEIRKLKKYFKVGGGFFPGRNRFLRAVDGIDLRIFNGETLGLVGESGCGKTTLGRLISRLEEPTEGEIFFDGDNILKYTRSRLKHFRKDVQFIFQDPYSSLNPRMSAGAIIKEGLYVHEISKGKSREDRVAQLMDIVGLSREQMSRYPHEFSGGQRQRIGIARALALNPRLIIADEPVSALDVSIQAQILNILKDLQKDFGLTYIFISHDLSAVGHISDRVAVMYLGKIVEITDKISLYEHPFHPYTKVLLSAIPVMDPSAQRKKIISQGDIPSPISPPSGCAFHPRCPYRMEICDKIIPLLEDKGGDHYAACHLKD